MLIIGLILLNGLISGYITVFFADFLPFKLLSPRLMCNRCGASLSGVDYYFLRQCHSCGDRKIFRSYIVLGTYLCASYLLWFFPPIRFNYYIALGILIYFGIITIVDLEYRVILHTTMIGGVVIFFIIGSSLHGFSRTLLGGVAGYLIMLMLYFLGILLIRLRNKNRAPSFDEALGFGDVNLGGVLGLLLGWPGVVAGLILAVFSAGIVSFLYIITMVLKRRYSSNLAIPYGPFLIFGTFLLIYFLPK